PAGYTKAAEKRAQEAVSIRIVPLDRLENFDPSTWPRCRNDRCKHGRIFWDGYPEISLVRHGFGAAPDHASGNTSFVHYVGKCDRCGRFHVRCVTCDDLLSLPEGDDDTGHQCRCKPLWFWLASVEQDEHGNRSAELHAILGNGQIITADRRAL
ncbi:MAG TPA: hypothetical protein VE397_14425, partial [Stellaceae bacterium]|nr:hypothetical protein [Stellaceae bacterium]